MAAHVLVVATVTATSDDLLAALQERAPSAVPVDFTLVMPAPGAGPRRPRGAAPELEAALDALARRRA